MLRHHGLPDLFFPPATPSWHVARPEVLARLRPVPEKTVSILWGPAGTGKSVLGVDHLRASQKPWLWFNLTRFDLDNTLFLGHFLNALQCRFADFEPSWAVVLGSTAQNTASSAVAGKLAESLLELAPEGIIIVMDGIGANIGGPLRVMIDTVLTSLPAGSEMLILVDTDHAPEPVDESYRVLGPQDLGMQDYERLRLSQHGNRCASEALDWLDWAWQNWLEHVGVVNAEPLPPPWQTVLPLAAQLPWLDTPIWQAVIEPLAPWPSASSRPPVLVALQSETPIWSFHPGGRRYLKWRGDRAVEAATARRLGVFLAHRHPLHAIWAFIKASDIHQAEALAAPTGEALLGAYHYQALAELLNLFTGEQLNASPRLCCLQGELERVSGRPEAALGHYQVAEELAKQQRDSRWQGRALVGQSAVWGMRGQECFYTLALQAKEILPQEDWLGRANVFNLLGIYHLQLNELSAAATYLEEALRLFGAIPDAMGEAKVLINLGLCHSKIGKFGKAKQFYLRAIGCAEASQTLPSPMLYNNLARIHLLEGNLKLAWDAAERALTDARQLGSPRDVAHAEWTLGEISAQREDWSKATVYFEASRQDAEELGDAIAQSNALASQAEIAMKQDSWTKARMRLEEAIRLRNLPLSDPAAFSLAEVFARLHLQLGEVQMAEQLLIPILRYTERHGLLYFQTIVEFALSRVHQAKGQTTESIQLWNSAIKRATDHDFIYLKDLESRRQADGATTFRVAPEWDANIQVNCLGHFDVRLARQAKVPGLMASKKIQQLLVHLMLNRKGSSRDDIAHLFGHYGDSRHSASLMLVSRLRQVLEPDLMRHQSSRFILLQDGRYLFNFGLNYRLDAEEFIYLCHHARDPHTTSDGRLVSLKRALELYKGPFLPFSDDEWCMIERERFSRLANQAYGTLLEEFMNRLETSEVIRLAEQAIKHDFLNEEAHRYKLLALAHDGRREDALKHFKRAEAHLEKRYALKPSDGLIETVQAILRGQLR
jgi:two-component SAPR family response regulator